MRIYPLLALLTLLPAPQAAKSQDPEFRKAIAGVWEKLATWCADHRLADEARLHAADALALDADNAKVKSLAARAGEATPADRAEYAAKLATTRKGAAALYLKWAATDDLHWKTALQLDPKGVAPAFEGEWRLAAQKAKWKRVATLLALADEALPADAKRTAELHGAEAKISPDDALLKKASTHDLRYWFSLPKGWTPARTWPVLVAVDGAGCGFEGQCGRFMKARGDLPLIVIAPCTFSNTNGLKKERYPMYPQSLLDEVDRSGRVQWDDAGLMVVLEDLKRDYAAEDRFFITGYSGGGILTWWNVLSRPARVRGAFPACANFAQSPREAPPEGGRDVPVRAFQGDKDNNLKDLTDQYERVVPILKEWGYTNYTREILPGVGHTACHAQVIGGIKELLKK